MGVIIQSRIIDVLEAIKLRDKGSINVANKKRNIAAIKG